MVQRGNAKGWGREEEREKCEGRERERERDKGRRREFRIEHTLDHRIDGIFFFSRERSLFRELHRSISWRKRAMEDRPPEVAARRPQLCPPPSKETRTRRSRKRSRGRGRKEKTKREKRRRKEHGEKREACGVFLNIDARERAHNHR